MKAQEIQMGQMAAQIVTIGGSGGIIK
jgi:hypothetical protein